jgi:hypothetical protein
LARQFLSRATQLEPSVRDQMAYRIYAEVLAQISPPPPPGAPPPLVLAAVLAERHRRELARLHLGARPPSPSPPGPPPSPGHVSAPAPTPAPRRDGFTVPN